MLLSDVQKKRELRRKKGFAERVSVSRGVHRRRIARALFPSHVFDQNHRSITAVN